MNISTRSVNVLPRNVLALLAATLCGPAQSALPDGISGTWYNPAQDGHGLSVSLVERGNRAVVIWHVYDPDGEPLTLYLDGVVQGREISGVVYAPIGMRFGEFDPEQLVLPVWGQATLRFADCESATLSWRSATRGYADGSTAIQPLALIAALPCTLPPPNPLASGLYTLFRPDGLGTEGWGIVDGEGRLWASDLFRDERVQQFPSFSVQARVRIAEVAGSNSGATVLNLQHGMSHVAALQGGSGRLVDGVVQSIEFETPGGVFDERWEAGAPVGTALVTPVTLSHLAGTYRIPYAPQFAFQPSLQGLMRIDPDGRACVTYRATDLPRCDLSGRLDTRDGEIGLVDFRLDPRPSSLQPAWRGRGWLSRVDGAETLSLVGENGEVGFLLLGRR